MTDIITTPVTITGSQALDASTATFTPGAAYAINMSAQIINAAWALGNTKYNTYADKVTALTAAIQTIIDNSTFDIAPSTGGSMSITEPTVTIPSNVDPAAILATFDDEATALIGDLATKVQYIFDTFFPDDSAQYASASSWIDNALSDTSGLPQAVRDQMLSDDLERITAGKVREQDSVIQQFAARRFAMPPGQAASAILQIAQKAQADIAESSRKLTIAGVERLQWAAEKLIGLRKLAMDSALEYAKLMAAAQNTAASVTGIGYDANSKNLSAVSSFFSARIDAAKAIKSATQFDAKQTQEAAEKNQVADLTLLEDKIKALMAETQALAQMATSLFNNVHAGGSSSYAVNGT
jgi:hypothetical protein